MKIKLISVLFVLLIIPTVNAGVGIVYGNEYLKAEEEGITCISYGIYNPWNDNATVRVSAGGELMEIVQNTTVLEIPAKTRHKQAVPVEICFKIPKIYDEECLFWKIGCKKECRENLVEYTGEVIASEITAVSGGGTGSRVTGAVTAPLTVRIKCEEKSRDLISIVGLIGLIVFAILSAAIWNNYRAPLSERKRKEAERLTRKKQELEKKLKKL